MGSQMFVFFSSRPTTTELWMSRRLCAAINAKSVCNELPKVSNFSAFIENLILRGRHTGMICDIKNGLEAASDKIFSVDERDVELWGPECINALKKGGFEEGGVVSIRSSLTSHMQRNVVEKNYLEIF